MSELHFPDAPPTMPLVWHLCYYGPEAVVWRGGKKKDCNFCAKGK